MRRALRVSLVALLLGGIGYLAAIRSGRVDSRPSILAAVAVALAGGLAIELGWLCVDVIRRRARVGAALGSALLVGGLLTAIAGGTLNWLLSLQGFVVLVEGETRRLGEGGQLEALEIGPWADPSELAVELALVGVELRAAGAGTFDPVSLIETRLQGEAVRRQRVGGGEVGAVGPLVLRQGTFGYAPRIVVTSQGRQVLDRFAPFTTRRDGRQGTSFSAIIEIDPEALSITGEVLLDSLDERMRGHPTLVLSVSRDGRPLGTGELALGEFAELDEGYRVGFAGLKQWAEIDLARRSYRMPALLGGAAALAGALFWPLAVWRRW